MIIKTELITCKEQYWSVRGIDPYSCIAFDIETTGFRATSSHLYLIGAATLLSAEASASQWKITQWFAERPQEEAALLRAFSEFVQPYTVILHFNGDRFDLPYLEEKYAQYGLPAPFGTKESVDLYRDFRPLKSFLKLEHMNQKSLERFLGLDREDIYDGGKLISVYRSFCKTGSEEELRLLLLHNAEDVTGMLTLTALYGYLDFLQKDFSCENAKILTSKSGQRELLLSFSLRYPLSKAISIPSRFGYLTLKDAAGKLLIPFQEDTFYYYFTDYKNYYYLPQEDQAIHKSVSAYVDKQYRQPAKADNCYIKKQGWFLPQPSEEIAPAFRRSYQDPLRWFSPEDTFFRNADLLRDYLNLLLQAITSDTRPVTKSVK